MAVVMIGAGEGNLFSLSLSLAEPAARATSRQVTLILNSSQSWCASEDSRDRSPRQQEQVKGSKIDKPTLEVGFEALGLCSVRCGKIGHRVTIPFRF